MCGYATVKKHQEYCEKLENIREVNQCLVARRYFHNRDLQGCQNVYFNDSRKMQDCCEKSAIKWFSTLDEESSFEILSLRKNLDTRSSWLFNFWRKYVSI